jgi:aspartyl-tRNA(Asn)/glutamyl-tRNA(Gln) amidotransferase subunit B
MPGTLPVINQKALEHTIKTGLALHCEIPERAQFHRKNYHYPDIPKGYQISQYDLPLCRNGWMDIDVDGTTKRIGITRVHLEEDTARSQHVTNQAGEDYSLVEFNRSGAPLMEIVTEPDVRSADEARAYLMKLQQTLRYLGVSAANMEEGNMRCEPNVSIRPAGSSAFGQKVELKNINSFRAVALAIEYEVERQAKLLDAGERVVQETRGWRDDTQSTVSQRTKEFAEDYRYFPEPDLPPIAIGRGYVGELRAALPELPDARRERFAREYALGEYESNLLTMSRSRADYFEEALATVRGGNEATLHRRAKAVANWMLGDLAKLLNEANIDVEEARVRPAHLHELIELIEAGTVSNTGAKDVLAEMFHSGKPPRTIVDEEGLGQISAADELSGVIEQVIDANPKPVADYLGGKDAALKALVGQVMKETRGRAKPDLVMELLAEALEKRRA